MEKLNWKSLASEMLFEEGKPPESINNIPNELKERSLFLEIIEFFMNRSIIIILDSN